MTVNMLEAMSQHSRTTTFLTSVQVDRDQTTLHGMILYHTVKHTNAVDTLD
jgi:hypothetical protein